MLKTKEKYWRTYLYDENNEAEEYRIESVNDGKYEFCWSTPTGSIYVYMYKNSDEVEFILTEGCGYVDEDDDEEYYFNTEKKYTFRFGYEDKWSYQFEKENLLTEYEKLFKLREWLDTMGE